MQVGSDLKLVLLLRKPKAAHMLKVNRCHYRVDKMIVFIFTTSFLFAIYFCLLSFLPIMCIDIKLWNTHKNNHRNIIHTSYAMLS